MTEGNDLPRATVFVVAAALIGEGQQVLLQKRPKGGSMPGLWEFPGGKVEAGEQPETALARELHEELGICVELSDLEPFTFASANLGEKDLILLLYTCRLWTGTPCLLHAEALDWVAPAQMKYLSMPPADVPLVAHLARLLQPTLPDR